MARLARSSDAEGVWRIAALALAVLAVAAAAPAALQIGFLSDDLAQLETARSRGWTDPLVPHHWAPLLTALYKSVHAGWLDAHAWHALVLGMHALNVWLACRLVHRRLEQGPAVAFATGALLALAPGGLEAVLWAAASPFVALLTVLLLALDRVLAALQGERPLARGDAAALAMLQLVGFYVWDWAIVLAPLLVAVAVVQPDRAARATVLRRLAPGLAPAVGVWCVCLLLRSHQGIALGYGLFPIGGLRASALLAAQPAMQLFPQLPKLTIALLAIPCLGLLGWGAIRSRHVRALLACFAVLQLPVYLQGAPSSRYAYLSLPFLVPALAISLTLLLPARAAACALVGWTLLSAWGHRQVSHEWRSAWLHAREVGRGLEAQLAGLDPAVPVVIVNLPDHDAAARGLWPPPMWRNGLSTLRSGALQIYTPEHAARFEPDRPRVVARRDVAELHPGAVLLEVTTEIGDGAVSYSVIPFDGAAHERVGEPR